MARLRWGIRVHLQVYFLSSSRLSANTITGLDTATYVAQIAKLTPQSFRAREKKGGTKGRVVPWSEGLPPKECVDLRAEVP